MDEKLDLWAWKNVPTEEEIAASIGFVYRITCVPNGKKYIGKKLFTSARKRKLSCKRGGKIVEVGKKKTVRDRVASGWESYFGSSALLLSDLAKHGKENFRREILQLAPSKGVLSYYELRHQMAEDALFRSDYYNGIINVRLGKNVFTKEMFK